MKIIMNTESIYKRDSKEAIRVWFGEVGVDGDTYGWRSTAGLLDGKKVTSGWKIVEQKNVGKANETSLEEQAVSEMNSDYDKKLERGYFKTIADIDKFTKIKPMLAAKYEDVTINFETQRYYTQPKLDGIRCIARADGLWSRGFKEIISVPHIHESLKWYFDKHPDAILDGELYNHDLRENFNKITSLVRKTKPEPWDIKDSKRLVEYHVYDLISSNEVFSKRIDELCLLEFDPCIQVVKTEEVHSFEEIDAKYGGYLEAGYEGQMVRADNVYQQNKRSKFLLKRKEFLTDEFTVIGVEEGKGNWSGHIKRFILELKDGTQFGAGVRGNQALLKEMYNNSDKPNWCTLRYFAPTPDGIPRFPVVIDWGNGVRED